jgi:preprotein translocase subunit YajC
MLLMFVVFWFILIRPQQKKAKEHQSMLSALSKGDTVITRGGLIGKVSAVQDNIVYLELQEKVRVKILKTYIEGKQTEKDAASAAKAEAKPEKKSDKKSDKTSEATADAE